MMDDTPQILLVTPPGPPADALAALPGLLDAVPVACLRLSTGGLAEDDIRRAADAAREIAHARDVAILIETHLRLVGPHGLDGVHLPDGHRGLREARRDLGAEAIIGCHCGASKHSAMTAAEMGADYVALGPFSPTPLGAGPTADPDLVVWWAEMIETPVVAEGGITGDIARALAPHADFIVPEAAVWRDPAALAAFARLLEGA